MCFMHQTQKEEINQKSKPFFHTLFFVWHFFLSQVQQKLSWKNKKWSKKTWVGLPFFARFFVGPNNPLGFGFSPNTRAPRMHPKINRQSAVAPEQFWIQPLASSSINSPGLALMIPRILGFFTRVGHRWRESSASHVPTSFLLLMATRNPEKNSWGWQFITLFTEFYTCQVVVWDFWTIKLYVEMLYTWKTKKLRR